MDHGIELHLDGTTASAGRAGSHGAVTAAAGNIGGRFVDSA